MSQPVVFAAPAEIDLEPDPIHPSWIVEGQPRAFSKRVAESADGTSSVVAWSCTPGRFVWHYAVDETLHVISGEAFVTDEKGMARRLGPGDVVFFPAGSHSAWHVTEEIRKLAVCRHSMPRPLGIVLRLFNRVVNRLTGFSVGTGGLEVSGAAPSKGVSPAAI